MFVSFDSHMEFLKKEFSYYKKIPCEFFTRIEALLKIIPYVSRNNLTRFGQRSFNAPLMGFNDISSQLQDRFSASCKFETTFCIYHGST